MFVQPAVPTVSLTQLHCLVVVVEVDMCKLRKFTFVRKQEPGIMIGGPMANCYKRSSRTFNIVEGFASVRNK